MRLGGVSEFVVENQFNLINSPRVELGWMTVGSTDVFSLPFWEVMFCIIVN